MKERPILFSAEMVRAILEGRKTQTRREIKFDKEMFADPTFSYGENGHSGAGYYVSEYEYPEEGSDFVKCPYGKVGDRLWVRETFFEEVHPDTVQPIGKYHYAATCDYEVMKVDGDGWQQFRKNGDEASPWKSPLFMPRHASRITLEITNVRVERLQDISEEDAIAEGAKDLNINFFRKVENLPEKWPTKDLDSPRFDFATLWQSIKGEGSWAKNPWVWVIEFKPISQIALREGGNK